MNYEESAGEYNDGISLTVPDMAIPLSVLIDRYIRGIDPQELRTPYWQEDGMYIPTPKEMDLVDIEEKRMELEFKFSQIENDVKKERADRQEKALLDKLKKEQDEKKEDI